MRLPTIGQVIATIVGSIGGFMYRGYLANTYASYQAEQPPLPYFLFVALVPILFVLVVWVSLFYPFRRPTTTKVGVITEGRVIGHHNIPDQDDWQLLITDGKGHSNWVRVTDRTFYAHPLNSYLNKEHAVAGRTEVTQR